MPDPYDKFRDKPRVYDHETEGSVLVGARFRHGRRQAGLSQRHVAAISGVSQSLISRFERDRCPGLAAKRIIAIAFAIGPNFPFAFCPHDHKCAWPYNPDTDRSFWDLLSTAELTQRTARAPSTRTREAAT